MSVVNLSKAEGRKLYVKDAVLIVSPVSKGTFTVSGSLGSSWTGHRRKTFKRTGLDSLQSIEDAVIEALDWLADNSR